MDNIDISNDNEAWDTWEECVNFIKSESLDLFSIVSTMGLADIRCDKIELAASPMSYAAFRLRTDSKLIDQLATLVSRCLYNDMAINIIDGEPNLANAPSFILVNAQRELSRNLSVVDEASNARVVQSLLKTFNGFIEDIILLH